ncbi:MAG: hypothetical protein NT004_05380 [Bacteroidetes bacterium]|nr:hypothetical protein [Bacteroidota bacterium]
MMKIEITNNWIDRYSEDDLNESEKKIFMTNLGRNSMLRKELLIDTRLNRFMEDKETIELMRKIKNIAGKPYLIRWRFTRLMVAASLLCLITFGAVYFLLHTDPVKTLRVSERNLKPEPETRNGISQAMNRIREVREIADITPITRREVAAIPVNSEIYKPMIEYELLVGAVTRNSIVRMVSPASEVKTKLNLPIWFKWTGGDKYVQVYIIIMNNKGKAVFSSPEIGKSQSYMVEPSKLGIGLFYWKVLVNDEIIMIGKIVTY